ncbi:uncharacterized protein DC041_0011958 [Schistosoma bovis]|uniref:DH domain-containing protein n=1 Tax=Schistosoma bovis TaxID=6184 RepID=A0A430Q065_SCHBO|nr:uncharacterized protein DC041_0011958 [Schistosoma bovis]
MYMIPLKQEKILDDQQVDTIFFKVQELLMYHMSFLNTLQMWELTNTVGDKLLDMMKLRMNRNKLPLKALLVQPVQRIPRYELLIKRLLESTPKDYSDHALLVEAESAIHRLALRVNAVHAAGEDENIERKDPVCIFMFTDQIVFTVARRRGSQVIKKPIFLRL